MRHENDQETLNVKGTAFHPTYDGKLLNFLFGVKCSFKQFVHEILNTVSKCTNRQHRFICK